VTIPREFETVTNCDTTDIIITTEGDIPTGDPWECFSPEGQRLLSVCKSGDRDNLRIHLNPNRALGALPGKILASSEYIDTVPMIQNTLKKAS